jgi:hypothetical protein
MTTTTYTHGQERCAVRTKNFPTRVERRRLRAQMPKGEKIEPDVSELRGVRTKIRRIKAKR